ncbi:polyhydroxybutyrate depolymerase [Bradyrhizobium sp. UFLA03-84]|uniref:alpha/beta hydrolase family esterase n=1 Tax=Bradyrhizobium sp. UFLA03-84 TaxID=418599 RepID=UPI000BAE3274|nr:PHB depolymerase family esterase [Bradyrhizobium sp. UFLA03-84]PAY09886.1 polyhydroxybutyrate depolymerase [Bradyrhizobium sp. UFLA03-84]
MRRRAIVMLALAGVLALGVAPAAADSLLVNGTTRTFVLQAPATRPAPLVIVLHGKTQSSADMMTRTSWPLIAKRDGFAVAYPDGLNHAWADSRPHQRRAGNPPPEGTDDVAFITQLIAKLVGDGTADPRRIYVTGISNGGAMAMTLVCERADLFAAAASVIMNLTDESARACRPQRPVPMLLMNGTADPLIPDQGGRGTSRFAVDGFWSTERTLQFWRRTNGCATGDAATTDLPDRNPSDQSTVTRIETNCPQGRDVVLYRVNGGGHRMPGNFPDAHFAKLATTLLGPQNGDIDGADTIWAFFMRFP